MVPPPPPPPPPPPGHVGYPPPPGHVGNPPPPHFAGTKKDPVTKLLTITNVITLWLLGAVTMSALMFANSYSLLRSSLSQHIYLCVIGYVMLMGVAVTSMSPFSAITSSFKHTERKMVHGIFQVIGSILALAGSLLRILNMNNNFTSAHAGLGIIAMILTFISLIAGVANMHSQKFKLPQKVMKTCHSCLGCLTLVTAFLALIFGFSHNIYRFSLGDNNANMCIAFTVVAIVGVCLSPIITIFKGISQ